MIVRISGEGQYELPDADAERLNELDNEVVAAVEGGDEAKFHELWKQMLDFICEEKGRALDDDELVESDVILPPRDTSFDEARSDFTGEGLIPD